MGTGTLVRIGIIGAGKGGTELLKLSEVVDQVIIAGICDINPAAPGIIEAARRAIPVYTSILDMIREQPMDWLINVADTSVTRRFLLTRELEGIIVIDGQIAELGWRIILNMYDHVKDLPYIQNPDNEKRKIFYTMAWSVISELAESARPIQNELMHIAFNDPLTDLYSRRILTEFIDWEIRRYMRISTPFSLAILDIDNFKSVNDRFGHHAGDSVLKELAVILKKSTRSNDLVGRYGGEEFIIVFHATRLEGASQLAENIRAGVEKNLKTPDGMPVTVSIGIGMVQTAVNPGTGGIHLTQEAREIRDDLISRADKALYMAKSLGKNMVCVESR
jgi:diguanylate cyclase (GGDEF)-like protein